ncbi:hypothetical protein LMB58_03635 [Limosilactobacillus reuteri]|uniref:hypothetical protein n=1 Tax=Limosilactobacillus reuteri TaxID=1598 RepID=UPI001E3F7A15|nr:hypothetical protein [Limosilactobacillus reuteri]MCC4327633.1 hypothetical protein [Limosilactobacillus reuteri]MCC4335532.1 hypothetical protein [Limosilactobacillus reuteri]MCC4337667.1 hypothetical protein [Limosilactobacillus reuteri]
MAERRMISRKIAEDDRFVDMHPVSKLLYFYLVLNADDDGFVGSVKMINFLTNADQSNYDELLENNLILEPTKNGVYVITDWYAQNKIEPKIYKATEHLSIRALLFIKTNFAYTTNPDEKDIISPVDYWVKQGRDKKTPPEIQAQQYLEQFQETSKKVPRSVEETSKKVLAQNRLDKNRLDKSRLEQNRPDQTKKEKINIDKDNSTSTSSIYNNATTENKGNSREKDGVDSGVNNQLDTNNNQDTVNSLFNYLNGISPTDIPKDNKRLANVFDMLIHNGYEIEDIQLGIDNIMNVANQMPQYQNEQSLAKLLIQHLPEYTKQTLEQSSSND